MLAEATPENTSHKVKVFLSSLAYVLRSVSNVLLWLGNSAPPKVYEENY